MLAKVLLHPDKQVNSYASSYRMYMTGMAQQTAMCQALAAMLKGCEPLVVARLAHQIRKMFTHASLCALTRIINAPRNAGSKQHCHGTTGTL